MVYTPPKYPTAIPSQGGDAPDLPDRLDDIDWLVAARYNELKKELCAVMTELGTLPKGAYASVKARLDAVMENPMTAAGDIIIGDTDGVPDRLPIGAANSKLFVNAAGTLLEFAVGIHVGSFTRDLSTGAGNVAYTGVGFKPSVIIFLANQNDSGRVSIGIETGGGGTNGFCIYNNQEAGAGSWKNDDGRSIFAQGTAGNNVRANANSMDADGFTLAWAVTGSLTGTLTVRYFAKR